MNDFEIYLQNKVVAVRDRRTKEGKETLSEIELFRLVLVEISYGELSTILKNFPDADVNLIIEKSIYIEARIRNYSPEDALIEMQRQMKNRQE